MTVEALVRDPDHGQPAAELDRAVERAGPAGRRRRGRDRRQRRRRPGPVPPRCQGGQASGKSRRPGGPQRGVQACAGDVVLFLDDDGWYPDPQLGTHVARRFAAEPDLAVISFRVMDPDGGPGQRRHVPRLRAGDPERSSPVTTFAGRCLRHPALGVPRGGRAAGARSSTRTRRPTWRGGCWARATGSSTTPRLVMCHPRCRRPARRLLPAQRAATGCWLARRNLPWPLAAPTC